MLRKRVSSLKYKEQILNIALELHKYNSQSLFLSSVSHKPARANQRPESGRWRLASDRLSASDQRSCSVRVTLPPGCQTICYFSEAKQWTSTKNHLQQRWTKIIDTFGIITLLYSSPQPRYLAKKSLLTTRRSDKWDHASIGHAL